MLTYLHHGDIGDIIYSLPVIKYLGKGILYLDINGGEFDPHIKPLLFKGKLKFNEKGYNYLYALLELQPYIEEVRIWNGEQINHNLSMFRQKFSTAKNLVENHLDYFSIPHTAYNEAWISIPKEEQTINLSGCNLYTRTLRYQSNYPAINGLLNADKSKKFFLGTDFEFRVFTETFDYYSIEHLVTNCAIDSLSAILSCDVYITNQGANHALAVAANKDRCILEKQHNENVCFFKNRTHHYL